MVERVCGTPRDKFLKVCEMLASTATTDRAATILYALGWTQHSIGSQIIRTGAMVQLLLGNIGIAGGGMNALRGHSNIQGLTDLGLMSNLLPGYMTIPTQKEVDFATYMSTRGFKPLRPDQMSYWQNYKKFFVSFMKSMWGDAAQPSNDFAYDWLPKLDVAGYDLLRAFELMHQGKMNGYLCQGFNPLLSLPQPEEVHGRALEAEVPSHDGSAGDRDCPVLGESRRVQRRRSVPGPDRGDPAAKHLLRRG